MDYCVPFSIQSQMVYASLMIWINWLTLLKISIHALISQCRVYMSNAEIDQLFTNLYVKNVKNSVCDAFFI